LQDGSDGQQAAEDDESRKRPSRPRDGIKDSMEENAGRDADEAVYEAP